jgi:hypothetical protein
VTYDQNFLQAIFGVADVTVSTTNGDKVVLNAEGTRERIWKLVLSISR